jgi:hypothetical protein
MRCQRLMAPVLLLVLLPGPGVWAQEASHAREAVERRARKGDRLTVDMRDRSVAEGRLVITGVDALIIDTDGREQAFAYGDIDRVRRRRNGVLMGTIIGLFAGFWAGIPLRERAKGQSPSKANEVLVRAMAYGLGIGICLDGSLSLNRTIYGSSAPSAPTSPRGTAWSGR